MVGITIPDREREFLPHYKNCAHDSIALPSEFPTIGWSFLLSDWVALLMQQGPVPRPYCFQASSLTCAQGCESGY
jgi:hypothetical protein